ncbi:MAG: oligosaccharide flippase family protein [Candidatus Moranbacteria bacterium]|jgi:O-antigen/teichoic acid export membrane protein|nr:oligosaccharide flippase family protein [Candidatus Moranbacteria bacterium]
MNWQDIKIKFSSQGAFAKNSAVLFAGGLMVNVFNYVFHLIIGRQVSAEVYGEAESLISLIAIISVPAATLTMVATKYAASCKAEDNAGGSGEILGYLNKKVFKYGFPIFLLAVIATPFIGKFLNVNSSFALILIWISMYVSFFNAVNSGLLSGWQKFTQTSLASVISTGVKFVFGVALVGFGFALNGIVGSLVLATLSGYVATLMFLKSSVMKKSSQEIQCEKSVDLKALKHYVMPVFAGSLAVNILGYADMVLAKHSLDASVAGQYGALTVASKIIFFATGVMASVLFSMSSENSHKGASSRHIFQTALALVVLASSFVTAVYFFYPGVILNILFGGKYQETAPLLGWFAVVVALFSVSNIIYQYLLSLHKTKISYVFLVIALVALASFIFFGKSIISMLVINIVAQAVAILAGIYFLIIQTQSRKS